MKVRISYVVDVDDETRRSMRAYYGLPGLATRHEVRAWYERFGDSMEGTVPEEDT